MKKMRSRRDKDVVRRRLDALAEAARGNRNVIPAMLDCARAYATLYEIREAMEQVYGSYREPVFF
jgi:methylmalonyl-CoA mutase N-terminal domain/subunit